MRISELEARTGLGRHALRFYEREGVLVGVKRGENNYRDYPEAAVRAEAAGALGDIGETRWLDAMLHLLKDGDPRVRASVAHALGDLQEKASIPALTSALLDSDKGVVEQVQWALMEMN